jgi:hypothetical protein
MPKADFRMLQLLDCRAVAQKNGRVALILNTDQWGILAFDVTHQMIDTLRTNLVAAEKLLRH